MPHEWWPCPPADAIGAAIDVAIAIIITTTASFFI
jgi:hypothetical protein